MKHVKLLYFLFFTFIFLIRFSPIVQAQDINQRIQETGAPFTYVLDTNSISTNPISTQTLNKKNGWTLLAEDDTAHPFKGDVVFLNDKIAVIVRQKSHGVEIYSLIDGQSARRATLFAQTSSPETLSSLEILENNPGAVEIKANYKIISIGLRLTTGERSLEILPSVETDRLRIESLCEYVIVPDFFSDDMVFSADAFDRDSIRLPTAKFFLQAIHGGDCMMMGVWESDEQNTRLILSGSGAARKIEATEIECKEGRKIWLALMENANLWHCANKQTIPPSIGENWSPPFSANWRMNVLQNGGMAKSFPFSEPSLQEQAQASCLIYPIDRDRATPLTTICPIDIMRNTLGVGPCQYILAAEGLGSDANPTTEQVTEWVERQFERKRETRYKDQIIVQFTAMTNLLTETEKRIERYQVLTNELSASCQNEARAHPQMASAVPPLLAILANIDNAILSKRDARKSPQYAVQLSDQIVSLIGKEDGLSVCQKLGDQLRAIGLAQDSTLSKCRMMARWFLQNCWMIAERTPEVSATMEKVITHAENLLKSKP
ncbi:MAG: hypothetical protein C4527_10740 [Candidatus Omnitrophota bacterium]|jgi:hypothetical protein|nr:MAG: hypothetical protein C4527_10740 [Candidatus Omnitrophota bacterium]